MHMCYSLNVYAGLYRGLYRGLGVIEGDTRSLGYSSYHGNLASLSSKPAFELWVNDLKLGGLWA